MQPGSRHGNVGCTGPIVCFLDAMMERIYEIPRLRCPDKYNLCLDSDSEPQAATQAQAGSAVYSS